MEMVSDEINILALKKVSLKDDDPEWDGRWGIKQNQRYIFLENITIILIQRKLI